MNHEGAVSRVAFSPDGRWLVLRDTLFGDAATLPVMTKPERARRADDQAQPNRPVTSIVSARSAHPGPRKPGLTLTGRSP
jgi:hypothetical protein